MIFELFCYVIHLLYIYEFNYSYFTSINFLWNDEISGPCFRATAMNSTYTTASDPNKSFK